MQVTDLGEMNVEELLKNSNRLKDLFNMDFATTEDNILLLKRMCVLLYERLNTLEAKVGK